MRNLFICTALVCLLVSAGMAQDPTFADFDSTPVFTDDFNAGGSPGPNGDWIIDADLAGFGFPSALQPPQFVGSLPAGLDAAFAGDPVANNPSGDSAVMLVGNLSADAGTHFGLAYIDLADPVAGSGNNSYETLTNYRFDATIFCLGTGDTFDRFQVGLYVHAGVGQPDLFRAGVFHNTSSDGSGPGFGVRGVATGSQTYPTPNPIANGRWVRMSIMVLGDRIATVVDANGDQILDESDPNEYQVWDRDTADIANGYPAVWTVGEVSSDVKPLFVDDVALYLLPGPPPPPRYLDVASLSVDQIITETELDAYKTANTLPTGVDFRSVGVDPTTGYLVFLDNNDGQISNMAGLMTLDPSDPDPASTLSVLVPAATLATALDGPATQSATNGLRYSADASILVWSEYGSVDDLVRIDDPGGANTVTNLLSQDGTAGIVLTPDETQLMVVTETSFGGSDDIQTLPIGGGSLSVLVDNTTLLAFTGATGFGAAGSSAQAGNGDLLVMDASEFGGGGDLLRITPTGALSVEVPASQLGPYESSQGGGGIDEIAADSLGNIYVFSEDAEPPDGGILIILAQGGSTIIDYSVIETVTGGNLFEVEGQVGVYEANDQVMLYLCDDQSPRSIVRLTFDTTQATAADDWALYR